MTGPVVARAGRAPASACGAQPAARPSDLARNGWNMGRRPKCNRLAGHEGPHRETERKDATVKWEWA